jgi:hypothetical protein
MYLALWETSTPIFSFSLHRDLAEKPLDLSAYTKA